MKKLGVCGLSCVAFVLYAGIALLAQPAVAGSSPHVKADAQLEDALYGCLKRKFPGIERDALEHRRAFDPKTGRNFHYDKEKKAWADSKTGESLCPVPSATRTTTGPPPTKTLVTDKATTTAGAVIAHGGVNCDCDNTQAPDIGGEATRQCRRSEDQLKALAAKSQLRLQVTDGKITSASQSLCDSVTAGPGAWPRVGSPAKSPY